MKQTAAKHAARQICSSCCIILSQAALPAAAPAAAAPAVAPAAAVNCPHTLHLEEMQFFKIPALMFLPAPPPPPLAPPPPPPPAHTPFFLQFFKIMF